MDSFQILIVLIFLAVILVGIAQKIHFPYPIVLVLGGIAIGFLPGLEVISFDPNLILLIVLPPILYYAAFSISFREFKRNWREIFSLALGLVIITTLVVGIVFKWIFPEFSWALAFAFGAIVSPPDAIAATTILKRFAISPRLLAILEGESLINDASALVLYRLAIAALLSGAFSLTEASFQFLKIVIGGIVIGFIFGIVLQNFSRKYLDSVTAVLFSFTIPYITYISADFLGVSGVLAVVVNGLLGSRIVAKHHSSFRRVLGFACWDILVIFMNCFIFILIGLQLRLFISVMTLKEIMSSIAYAAFVTLALIVVRLLWIYSKSTIAYFKTQSNSKNDKLLSQILREATIAGWSGMRGIVSLTAALALPYTVVNGLPLEGRDTVIFMTFIVILITLLLPSLTLRKLLSIMKIDHHMNHHEAHQARKRLAKVAQEKIHHLHKEKNVTEREFNFLINYFVSQRYVFEISTSHLKKMSDLELARLNIFKAQRRELLAMWERQEIDDKLFQQLEHELDVEESHIPRAELT